MPIRRFRSRTRGAGVIVALVFTASACSSTDTKLTACEPGPAPLEAVFGELIAADNARDVERVLDSYTEGVVWLPPSGEAVIGKAAVQPRYERMFRNFQPAIQLVIVETQTTGALGVVRGRTHGHLRPVSAGDVVTIDDKFIGVLRCSESRWLISHLSWSPRSAQH